MKKQYEHTISISLPPRMPRAIAERWASQYALEQAELLELLLHLYYDVVPPGLGAFLTWALIFANASFGARQINYSSLNEEGRATTSLIKYLSVLVLLELMDLEFYASTDFYDALMPLNRVDDANGLSYTPDCLTEVAKKKQEEAKKYLVNFQDVQRLLMTWGSDDAHGPILLAWSAILSRVGTGDAVSNDGH